MAVTIRNATVAISAGSSTKISEFKTSQMRRVLEICNLNVAGGNDVFVTVGSEAGANLGRRVQPGQTVVWSIDSAYIPPQDVVFGYSAGATNVSVYEEVA